MSCSSCGDAWKISNGPGRIVGPIARSIEGISAPLPDHFVYEYCARCGRRNMTPELEKRLLAIESAYLAASKSEAKTKPKETVTALERWALQDAEWRAIRDDFIEARPSEPVTAYQVSLEQRKRMLARGERPVTYEEIVAEYEASATKETP